MNYNVYLYSTVQEQMSQSASLERRKGAKEQIRKIRDRATDVKNIKNHLKTRGKTNLFCFVF